MSLGDRIRTARQRARLTQEQLAARVGVGRRTVDNWENGRTSPANTVALEDVLGSLNEEVATDEGAGDSSPPTEQPTVQPAERFVTEDRTHRLTGRVWQIVRDLEADTQGIPEDEAEAMIQRAMDNAENQARLMLETERRRWERRQDEGPEIPEHQT